MREETRFGITREKEKTGIEIISSIDLAVRVYPPPSPMGF